MRTSTIAFASSVLVACQAFLVLDGDDAPDASSAATDAGASDAVANDGVAAPQDGGDEATFNDDFERDKPEVGWDGVVLTDASLSIVDGGSKSPRALRAVLDGPWPSGFGYMSKSLGRGRSITCSFDLRLTVTAGGRNGYLDVFWFALTAPGFVEYTLRFALHDRDNVKRANVREDIRYSDGGTELPAKDTETFFELPAIEEWERVTVSTDFATVTVRFGDRVVVDGSPVKAPPTPTDVIVNLGARVYSFDRFEALSDNLSCTLSE